MKRIILPVFFLFLLSISVSAQFSLNLDFDDPSNIDTANGWVSFVPAAFTEEIGYGWEEGFDSGNVLEKITTAYNGSLTYLEPQSVYRDHHESRNPHNFTIKIPNGYYQVKLYFGKTSEYGWYPLNLTVENKLTVSNLAGSERTDDYRLAFNILVNDGYLNLDFEGDRYYISGIDISDIETYPSINPAPNISHGEEITISGSNFGSKSPAAPLIWDNFESGILGEDLSLTGWEVATTADFFPVYSDLEVYAGNLSGRAFIDGVTTGGSRSAARKYLTTLTSNIDEIYTSHYLHVNHISGIPTNMKFLRVVNEYYSTAPDIGSSSGDGENRGFWTDNCQVGTSRFASASVPKGEGKWQREEIFGALSTVGVGDGTKAAWIDNSLKYYDDGFPSRMPGCEGRYYESLWLPFYAGSTVDSVVVEYYYDDVYIDTTQARVEICSGSNWHTRTDCAIQIPSAWSNNSITFTANTGRLNTSGPAYLYVVDETGIVNENGFEINFGEEPPCVPETEICNNGTDEDCDNSIDCDDSDCDGTPECPVCTPTTEICGDGIDQDCDEVDMLCPVCPEAITERCDCGGTPYETGYCCSGSWQIGECTVPGRCDQATIESILGAPVISLIDSGNGLSCGGITGEATPRILMRGTVGEVSEAFTYEYDATVTVSNTVQDLLQSENYIVLIQNITTGQAASLSLSSNSSGELNFDVAPFDPPSTGPQISSAPSNLIHKGSFTISGSNFGVKGSAEPMVWDDFEDGTIGETIRDNLPVIGSAWGDFSQPPLPSYSNTRSHAGSLSTLIQWQNYSISSINTNWDSSPGPLRRIFLSYWRYMEPQVPGELPNNHKQFYVFGWDSAGDELPQMMMGAIMPVKEVWATNFQNTPTFGFDFSSNVTRTWSETINQWQRWDVYAEIEEPYTASSGIVKTWINGQIAVDETNVNITDVDGLWHRLGLGNMYGGYHPGGTDRSYFDNVYIDNTQARIELCNVSTWAQKNITGGNCEIQIPSAWSTGSITFTANQGTFNSSQTAYLYVIDSEGNVSNSFPVRFSG
ncbi:MAG: hypothetical protein ABID38_03000 [Candidatus Diapherotrites archaeon]